jgi:hypothetical protein
MRRKEEMKPKLNNTSDLLRYNKDMIEYLEFENYYNVTNDYKYLIKEHVKGYKYDIGKIVKIIPNPYILQMMSSKLLERKGDWAVNNYIGEIVINSLLNFDFQYDITSMDYMGRYYKYTNILSRLFNLFFDELKDMDLRMIDPSRYHNIALLYNNDIKLFLNNVDVEYVKEKGSTLYTNIIDSLLYYIIMNIYLYKLYDPKEDNPSSYIIELLRLNDIHKNAVIDIDESDLYENASYDMNNLAVFSSYMYIEYFFNNLNDKEWDYIMGKMDYLNDLVYGEKNLLGEYVLELYEKSIKDDNATNDNYSVLLDGFRKERNN